MALDPIQAISQSARGNSVALGLLLLVMVLRRDGPAWSALRVLVATMFASRLIGAQSLASAARGEWSWWSLAAVMLMFAQSVSAALLAWMIWRGKR